MTGNRNTNARLIRKQANRTRVGEVIMLDGRLDWGSLAVFGPARLCEVKKHTEDTVTLIFERTHGVPVRHYRNHVLCNQSDMAYRTLVFTMAGTDRLTRYAGPMPPPTHLIEEFP